MIYNYDFQNKKLISKEEFVPLPETDHILERIKQKVDHQTFQVFETTINAYFAEAFSYQMEKENGIRVEKSRWDKE